MYGYKIYPNLKVSERMFNIADDNHNGKIDFKEFMINNFMLIKGTEHDKILFIFRMISQ